MPEPRAKARAKPPTAVAGTDAAGLRGPRADRKSTRLNSSHSQISYAVFCLKKKKRHLQSTLRRGDAHQIHYLSALRAASNSLAQSSPPHVRELQARHSTRGPTTMLVSAAKC